MGLFEELALAFVAGELDGLFDGEPLGVVYFVVVVGYVARNVGNEEVVDFFVVAGFAAGPAPPEPVFDWLEGFEDAGGEAGFFADFAEGGFFEGFGLAG